MNIEFHYYLKYLSKTCSFKFHSVCFHGEGVAYQKNVMSDFEPLEVGITLIGCQSIPWLL